MKLYFTSAVLFLSLLPAYTSCQERGDETLLTVNGEKVSAAEFEWAYKKNNSGSGKSTIDEYLALYIDFKLKVEAARDAGIDKRPSFTKELAGYRKQLARNYLTDQKAKEQILLKAYDRYKEEINAYHILIKCSPDALPADTVEAWEKARKVRERLRLGEPFESVARGASDDPYVTINGGNLGYFTAFQTPIAFENAVYSMRPGSISGPVRTASGYHIIKVQDRRASMGKIRVAHIMKALPQGSGEVLRDKAKREIDSLYLLVKGGSDFATIANENSDDIVSASNGGELPFFGSGEMVMNFSETAFSLLRDGDISKPVKSVYGWHIIKRLEKQPFPDYEQAKNILESRLSQSYLLSQSRKSFAEKLKGEYNFKVDNTIMEWFYSIADSTFISGSFNIEEYVVPHGNLYSFADRSCDAADFLKYIKEKGSQSSSADAVKYINSLYELKIYEELIGYEESVLETKYPEFRYLINEFHDGILLFEISDSLIWQNGTIDNEGIREYYQSRKEEFSIPTVASGVIYKIDNDLRRKKIGKLIKTIKKYSNQENGLDEINNMATAGGRNFLTIEKGTWVESDMPLLNSFKWSKGYHQFSNNNNTFLVDFESVTGSGYRPFEEVRDTIVDDYLKVLEIEWLKQLRLKYSVIIDYKVLNSVKTRLSL